MSMCVCVWGGENGDNSVWTIIKNNEINVLNLYNIFLWPFLSFSKLIHLTWFYLAFNIIELNKCFIPCFFVAFMPCSVGICCYILRWKIMKKMDQNPMTQKYLTISLFFSLRITIIFVDIIILKFLNMVCFLMPACIATHCSLLPGILQLSHFSMRSVQRAYSLNPLFIFSTLWYWQNNPLFFSANNCFFLYAPAHLIPLPSHPSWNLHNFSFFFSNSYSTFHTALILSRFYYL